MTLSIPEDLHAVVRRHPEVSWSAVAREAMWTYARKLAILDQITAESQLTEAEVESIGKEIKKAIRRRHAEARS